MKYCTPEQVGISSHHVRRFFERLDFYNLSTHSVILCRGEEIFSECYYKPFHKDFLHRMYSVSKTFLSIAVGFCIQDGLLSFEDSVDELLSDYTTRPGAFPQGITVKNLLQMQTRRTGLNWFPLHPEDRVDTYFSNEGAKMPGTLFDYDSSGSFLLGVLVERLTGKPFLEYLKEKVLNDIGFSKESYCLKAPGGHSFGDSGVMCTARDLLLFARFVLNGGTFHGKRYLNEDYIRQATDTSLCNSEYGFRAHDGWGYGFQIWGQSDGCFAMLGMGNQIALCDPKHDFIFIITSDNQGNPHNYEQVFEALYNHIIYNLNEDGSPLPEDPAAHGELINLLKDRNLFFLKGETHSDFARQIHGKTFFPAPNPMEIKWFRLEFEEENKRGVFHYENAQGEKQIPFGFGHNEFAPFPQEGYSDLTVNVPAPGNTYRAAFSADWPEPRFLRIRVQIIDKYFGNLAIVFGFCDADNVTVRMRKTAEDFLSEYQGILLASTTPTPRA